MGNAAKIILGLVVAVIAVYVIVFVSPEPRRHYQAGDRRRGQRGCGTPVSVASVKFTLKKVAAKSTDCASETRRATAPARLRWTRWRYR